MQKLNLACGLQSDDEKNRASKTVNLSAGLEREKTSAPTRAASILMKLGLDQDDHMSVENVSENTDVALPLDTLNLLGDVTEEAWEVKAEQISPEPEGTELNKDEVLHNLGLDISQFAEEPEAWEVRAERESIAVDGSEAVLDALGLTQSDIHECNEAWEAKAQI